MLYPLHLLYYQRGISRNQPQAALECLGQGQMFSCSYHKQRQKACMLGIDVRQSHAIFFELEMVVSFDFDSR